MSRHHHYQGCRLCWCVAAAVAAANHFLSSLLFFVVFFEGQIMTMRLDGENLEEGGERSVALLFRKQVDGWTAEDGDSAV